MESRSVLFGPRNWIVITLASRDCKHNLIWSIKIRAMLSFFPMLKRPRYWAIRATIITDLTMCHYSKPHKGYNIMIDDLSTSLSDVTQRIDDPDLRAQPTQR